MKRRVHCRRTTDTDAARRMHRRTLPADKVDIEETDAIWLAKLGRVTVGFATARYVGRGTVHIPRMGVLRSASGYGAQRRLLAVIEAWARADEIRRIETYVMWDNYKSLANFLRCGYRGYEPRNLYAGKSVIYLQKNLEGSCRK